MHELNPLVVGYFVATLSYIVKVSNVSLVFQIKQRIIDVDTKNSIGLLGHIEELSHNALAVYWNPLESPAKVNLAIQCLSTDFRSAISNKNLFCSFIFVSALQYTKRSEGSAAACPD